MQFGLHSGLRLLPAAATNSGRWCVAIAKAAMPDAFLPSSPASAEVSAFACWRYALDPHSLVRLGWRPFFQQQLSIEEYESALVVRVSEVQRSVLFGLSERERVQIELPGHERWSERVTVGDWVLANTQGDQHYLFRVLDRENGIVRKAAGTAVAVQWLGANLDTVFIAMACDQLFSVNRLERYLAVVVESGITPVLVLTKADCVAEPALLLAQLPGGYGALAIDTRDTVQLAALAPYLESGRTVAVIGMSGAGKSTLVNTLLGTEAQRTSAVREGDGHGRHTTTSRNLLKLPTGAWIIDTPGMREMQLAGSEESVALVFPDVDALTRACRFADCKHLSEPDCRVRAALDSGALDVRRWQSYCKLLREQAFAERQLTAHHELVAQRRKFTRKVKSSTNAKKKLRNTSFDRD